MAFSRIRRNKYDKVIDVNVKKGIDRKLPFNW
jgi:hypothetical protein